MKKKNSTFDRYTVNPTFRKEFDEGYQSFLLSELLCALMEEDEKSVRQLAAEIGVSPTTIQNIRSGKQEDIGCGTL